MGIPGFCDDRLAGYKRSVFKRTEISESLVMPGSKADLEEIMEALEQPETLYPVNREDLFRSAGAVLCGIRQLRYKD